MAERPKLPRKSSYLGGEIRGDTSVGSFHSMSHRIRDPPSGDERTRRRRAKSTMQKLKKLSLRRTWLPPLVLIAAILSAYFINPGKQNPFHAAIFVSYPLPPETWGGPTMYGKGWRDFIFVGFYLIVFSFTREFLMQQIIRPMAIRAGIRKRGKQARFMEQVYTAMYFSFSIPLGIYVMYHTDMWYFNTTAFYSNYPHKTDTGIFKAYYLLQAAYWAQQALVLVLMLEKPRKDFKELVLHHIITLSLIGLSYRCHFTHIGIAVYITHDVSDFFLATSKTLNYLDSVITGPYFALFIAVWVYTRHYLNLRILWSVLTEFSTVGPFDADWYGEQFKGRVSQCITLVLLGTLQMVNLFWLYLIWRIAKNYVFNDIRQDERSDDEEDDESTSEPPNSHKKPIKNGTVGNSTKPTVMLNGEPVDTDGGNVRKRSAKA